MHEHELSDEMGGRRGLHARGDPAGSCFPMQAVRAPTLEELQAEVLLLRKENERLRSLLGPAADVSNRCIPYLAHAGITSSCSCLLALSAHACAALMASTSV